jgi:hypothetical protein
MRERTPDGRGKTGPFVEIQHSRPSRVVLVRYLRCGSQS